MGSTLLYSGEKGLCDYNAWIEDVTFGGANQATTSDRNRQTDCRVSTEGRCCQSHFDCLKWYPCWGDQPHIGWLDISQGAAANLQGGVLPLFRRERWYK